MVKTDKAVLNLKKDDVLTYRSRDSKKMGSTKKRLS